MAEEKKDTALEVATDRTRLSALVGTLGELITAFDQIGANLAALGLNGWDSTQKCKAACWLAHGAGMHPAVFIQNHYCMVIQGKLIVEPKMEFILGVLQSRVGGFRFKIEEEEDDHATVWMTDGKSEVRKSYDIEDAKRLGLLSRGGNMLTGGATREWCLKQAVKKAGRMIGAAALMDLPGGLDTYEAQISDATPKPSAAEAIGEAIDKAAKGTVDVPFEDVSPAPAGTPVAPPVEDPRTVLSKRLTRYYGKLSKAVALEKTSLLYNAMSKERTGVDPNRTFRRADEIGPIEAEQIIEYLDSRMKKNGHGGLQNDAPSPVRDSPGHASSDDADAPPPEADGDPDEIARIDRGIEKRLAADAYDELMTTVARARKLFNRKFIQESPPGSAKFWFTDQATFSEAGDSASVKIQVGPDIVAPIEKIDALNRILSAACDEQERGGR